MEIDAEAEVVVVLDDDESDMSVGRDFILDGIVSSEDEDSDVTETINSDDTHTESDPVSDADTDESIFDGSIFESNSDAELTESYSMETLVNNNNNVEVSVSRRSPVVVLSRILPAAATVDVAGVLLSLSQHSNGTNAMDTGAVDGGIRGMQAQTLESGAELNVVESNLDTSLNCFKIETKKLPSLPMAAAKPDVPATDSDVGDDAECCPICFEPWTNSGIHRLASLRCGHLFGKSCIEKWLKTSVGKCPQCNAKAQRKDIRPLFARTLKTIDTTERDRALEELERERVARRTAELEAARARMNHQMALNECNQLRQELERQRQQLEQCRQSTTSSVNGHSSTSAFDANRASGRGLYIFEKQIRISENGGCRVLTYCHQMATLCISQPSSNPLFPGFGFKKLSALDFKTSQFVSIHTKPIRDLATNGRSTDATLLSCSMDKFVKLTSLHSNSVIQMFECAMPVWSCAWNTEDRNYFYAGLPNGTVSAFDVRNLSEPVFQLGNSGSGSPVVSLQYLPVGHGSASRPGGLLVGQLACSSFYERRSATDFRVHMLPLEASLTSLSLEEATGHILATYRPTARNPSVRHQVCELSLKSVAGSDVSEAVTDVACNSVHVFHGGATQKLLARSRLVLPPGPGGELLTCAGDEASLSVYVWNAGTGQLQQKLSTTEPVIDLCPFTVNSQPFLVALTEKQMTIYRWKQGSR